MHQSNSYIDPTALSSPSESEPGPSRKRARADLSTEERKEARAHRNRIAAQNSRDRRKAQFSHLERRVAELEEENRQLRAGMGLTPNVSLATPARLAEEEKERQRQCAQERENEELKERIRTLEKGWDAVIKALAAQGFPSLVAQPPAPLSTATVSPSESSTRTSSPAESISSITSPAPPFKPESSPLPDTTFPLSPAPSYTSLNFDSSPSPMFSTAPELPPSPSLRNIKNESVLEHDSTRHLAAGGFTSFSFPLRLDVFSSQTQSYPGTSSVDEPSSTIDEAAMECLLREILATSPSIEANNLPLVDTPLSQKTGAPSTPISTEVIMLPEDEAVKFDVDNTNEVLGLMTEVERPEVLGNTWVNEVEIHKMLGSLLPVASSLSGEEGTLPELELGWELDSFTNNAGTVGINVF